MSVTKLFKLSLWYELNQPKECTEIQLRTAAVFNCEEHRLRYVFVNTSVKN